eukprot:NODE_555_length_6746_cov_0.227170.p2 type:complete len:790 gc:universal NODE_555_length_6746_cov_0.227170:3610-1241(-)
MEINNASVLFSDWITRNHFETDSFEIIFMSKFDYLAYFDYLVHQKHHMISYSVQRILLQLITGAQAPVVNLVQSAKIFFHYRFIPWECVSVNGRTGIVVPYQQESSYDLIVGKADIKYIEDVYTLMWYPYLILFIEDIRLETVVTGSLLGFIESLANFNNLDSVHELYKRCIFVPRLFINRHPDLELNDFKITELLRLYTRNEKCLKIKNKAASYYNLSVAPNLMLGSPIGQVKDIYQGTLLPPDFNCGYYTSLTHRHSRTPDFTELPQVTWTRENADSLPIINFRPSPRRLIDAMKDINGFSHEINEKNVDACVDSYCYLVCSAEYLGLYPFTMDEYLASLLGENNLIEQIFLSLLYIVRSTIEKDKYPISNSQKYISTDKATAMVIKDGDIDDDLLKRASVLLNYKLAEKKMFKYTRYYKPVSWIFCFAIFLREFVDVEQVENLLDILEMLLLSESETDDGAVPMQVDGGVDSDDDQFRGPDRAITRSMEEITQDKRRPTRSASDENSTENLRDIPAISAVSSSKSSVQNLNKFANFFDENTEIAQGMIYHFYDIPADFKIQLISYMISVVMLSREYAIFVDKSIELQQNAVSFTMRHIHVLKNKQEYRNSLMGDNNVEMDALNAEIIKIENELQETQRIEKLKLNSRIVPLGYDRYHNEYYFLDDTGPFIELKYGLGVLLIRGSGLSAMSSEISHYCYVPSFPTEYKLEIPKGMDTGYTPNEWMCYTLIEEVDMLMEWLFDGISEEAKLKKELRAVMPGIERMMSNRNTVVHINLASGRSGHNRIH